MPFSLKHFPSYTESDYQERVSLITPVEDHDGCFWKRDDYLTLGGLCGGKVRQCLSLIHDRLERIKTSYNGMVTTAAGLPSPQTAIVAVVARYFGLKCNVVVPLYKAGVVDEKRINVSIAQRAGASVYGSVNPRPSGVEKMGRRVSDATGSYYVSFGMSGPGVMQATAPQAANLPDTVETVVMVIGSGLSFFGVATGLRQCGHPCKRMVGVTLSNRYKITKSMYYDRLPDGQKFGGEIDFVRSPIPYQTLLDPFGDRRIDLTYESKAYEFLQSRKWRRHRVAFWIVGIKEYDLRLVQNINWKEVPAVPLSCGTLFDDAH